MRTILMLALVLAACDVPPAWTPGDGPLTYWTTDDRAAAAFQAGCERWAVAGITCVRVDHDATVLVYAVANLTDAAADTRYRYELDLDPNWGYYVHFPERTLRNYDPNGEWVAVRHAAHEVGHLMGIWDHVEEGPALMTSSPSSNVPTTVDLDALGY